MSDDEALSVVLSGGSRFFTLSELRCKDGTPYPEGWVKARGVVLLLALDAIREEWGSAIKVVSGYRTSAYNTRIGGARMSQHVEGRAADLRPLRYDGTLEQACRKLHDLILGMRRGGRVRNVGGLGLYPTFVHVDVRKSDRLARWVGSRATT